MGERRTYSRTARKQLDSDERSRLIEEMLGAEATIPSVKPSAAPALAKPITEDSFDALDALDAEFDEELSDIRAEETAERARKEMHEHNALVDDAIEQLSSEFEPQPKPELELECADPILETTPVEDVIEPADEAASGVENASVTPLTSSPEFSQAPEDVTDVADPAPVPEFAETVLKTIDPGTSEAIVAGAPASLGDADLVTQQKLRQAYETAQIPESNEPADLWNKLAVMPVDVPHLEENLVITASRNEPAHGAFDVLRTRLVHTLLEHGWKRVAITSPSRNCGKTFTAVNLAISLSRYEANRTILLDMDMRNPSVAGVIGDPNPGCMGDFLRGATSAEDFLVKFDRNNLNIGSSLAIGTNGIIEPYAAELAQDPATGANLDKMMQEMSPDIVLFDMPPALAFDDVIAFRKQFDGVLMVVGGGSTSPEEVREVMRRLGEDTPLLGVVLNQAEGEDGSDYSYGY